MTQSGIYTFSEALEYLYSFVNWEVERHVRYSPEVMTLDRPRRVMEAFGNPHEQYPILHITGTKGKGSVGAMVASALQASGLKVGLYSSPHLQDFRERFRINNALIPEDEFTLLVNDMRSVLDTIPDITWFEVTTALAFLYFAREGVDAAVIEVGLGGRLDATNIVTPVASVITSISYDHMHLLGNSLAEIAGEKGGIIKPGVPVISAPQPQEALDVLVRIAAEQHAPLTLVGRDWLFEPGALSPYCQPFRAGRAGEPMREYATGLPGEHQAINATVALAALDTMQQAGVGATQAGTQAGLAGVDWPGRLEVVERKPLLVLDAAHNGESAQRLAAALTGVFDQRPIAFVFGASADKDVSGMFDHLLPIADYLIVSQAVHPRALDPHEIRNIALAHGYRRPIEIIPDTRVALERASELVGEDGMICTTGSLFIIGEVRSVYGLPAGHVPRASRVPCAPASPEV
ncbi:bifunctional folylpolyglutamate synthase/dihydrofolate synthase [Aggregatilinea lenta]|uniref:bifunctional folylpolyglutamate synthase/dihydrofolate synthase n=1 Tax=Aggregatilinea lenta TaxID=913108 RepID=UPI000E5B9B39|nr:folylpolyglutamate synthase/dihydrofolate synthase family protein [Aggregatilinea lenta]